MANGKKKIDPPKKKDPPKLPDWISVKKAPPPKRDIDPGFRKLDPRYVKTERDYTRFKDDRDILGNKP